MPRLLVLSIAVLLTVPSIGCECCDSLQRFEAWKQETLFGCFCPGYSNPAIVDPCAVQYQDPCAAACGDPCATTIQQPCCTPGIVGQPIIQGQPFISGPPIITTQPGISNGVPTLSPGPETYAPTR